ncbi:potassium-transporting ATPase subunit KdpC [Methyloversatilis discipulorum]|uniref:potassium-transporting ATPase subunit KdpC n=1 Tax=Methyloversatilis discipulorum TaxID=1119528 RepID=UPI0026EB2C89|nr:potassium-transporting ATPase subunit KdpC [Methyloversatilis discipulorum]
MNAALHALRPALSLFLLLSALTGLAYPLLVTALAQTLFPERAAGSLIRDGEQLTGSALIGQPFSSPGHFWSRPSATAPQPYNGAASGGSNLGANNRVLIDAVAQRVAALRAADPDNRAPVPVDLVTASASGLDPDISLAAARYQAARVARARGVDPAAVEALIDRHARHPWLGFIGEPRVNVLALNRALAALR